MTTLEETQKKYESLLQQLSNPELISDTKRFEELSKKKKKLEKIIEKEKEIEEIKNKIEENKSILSAREDRELVSLAEEDLKNLIEKEQILKKELENLLKEGDEEKRGSQTVIVEIRAGTGGKEAALFARDLFRMYSKYGQSQNWRQKTLDSNSIELGGLKEIIFELKATSNVYSKMKYEAGVHRVQRIPETEKGGRIHTSTATVAVLPKPQKTEIKIRPDDLKTDVYAASGPGGQYVNKRQTAVRITHLPSGIVATCQTERSLKQNKENALSILEARILEKKEQKETEKLTKKRRSQIGGAKRAEKIRTYNFPQNRLTDHRLKKSWHNLEEIMEGKLEPIIEVFEKTNI